MDLVSSPDIIAELTKRGYKAKPDGSLITFDINPEPGICRTYIVERAADLWQVNVFALTFAQEGEPNEEQTHIGDYSSATEIVDSIDDHESGL